MVSEAPCTRCGSLIHSRMLWETSEHNDVYHVICTGCDFEWVE